MMNWTEFKIPLLDLKGTHLQLNVMYVFFLRMINYTNVSNEINWNNNEIITKVEMYGRQSRSFSIVRLKTNKFQNECHEFWCCCYWEANGSPLIWSLYPNLYKIISYIMQVNINFSLRINNNVVQRQAPVCNALNILSVSSKHQHLNSNVTILKNIHAKYRYVNVNTWMINYVSFPLFLPSTQKIDSHKFWIYYEYSV